MKKVISSFALVIKVAIPALLSLGLLTTWIWTERTYGRSYFQDFVVLVVLLGTIFLADSLEVSYSLLRHKHMEQFKGSPRRVLEEIHRNEDLVYDAREWLVTFLIVLVTLRGEFRQIFVPFYGKPLPDLSIPGVVSIPARTIFSLLFATLPVLWLAQSPSKRVARAAPLKVLDAASMVWGLIKKVGWIVNALGLNGPSEKFADLLSKSGGFRDEQDLRPSDFAFYVASVLRYGYSLHDLSTRVVIDEDGASTITMRVVYYVIARPCNIFVRKLKLDAPTTGLSVLHLAAYEMPRIRDSDPVGTQSPAIKSLDGLLAELGDPSGRLRALSANLTIAEETDSDNRSHYRIDTHGSVCTESGAYAIVAELQSKGAPGSFRVAIEEADYYLTSFDCPTYKYRLTVENSPECKFRLGDVSVEAICGDDPHWGERDRFQASLGFQPILSRAIYADISFPFPGTKYVIRWKNTLCVEPALLPHCEQSTASQLGVTGSSV